MRGKCPKTNNQRLLSISIHVFSQRLGVDFVFTLSQLQSQQSQPRQTKALADSFGSEFWYQPYLKPTRWNIDIYIGIGNIGSDLGFILQFVCLLVCWNFKPWMRFMKVILPKLPGARICVYSVACFILCRSKNVRKENATVFWHLLIQAKMIVIGHFRCFPVALIESNRTWTRCYRFLASGGGGYIYIQ